MANELTLIDKALLDLEPFPVDFDDAWQWVGYSRKDVALEMLKKNFENDVDFSGKRRKSTGGRPLEAYRLTADCFKEFCMMAGTEKGKQVRRYFIEAEKRLKILIEDKRLSKAVRRELTDAIQDAKSQGLLDMHGFEYKAYTDLVYKVVLGVTAKTYRDQNGLDQKENIRQYLTAGQISLVKKLEKMVTSMIDLGYGYDSIKKILETHAQKAIDKR